MSDHLELKQEGRDWLLANPAQVENIRSEQFDTGWWSEKKRLIGGAPGRGTSVFLDAGDREWVLRPYLRGGLFARVVHEHYLWLGAENSRPFRELRLLNLLWNTGLPVAEPVAARAQRRGLAYRADLITVRIPGGRPLADVLEKTPLPADCWRDLGAMIARFHREGVYHHDLNGRNILLDDSGSFWLIDFDRCGIRKPGRWCQANLQRLKRSMDKFSARMTGFHFLASDWQALLTGYRAFED